MDLAADQNGDGRRGPGLAGRARAPAAPVKLGITKTALIQGRREGVLKNAKASGNVTLQVGAQH